MSKSERRVEPSRVYTRSSYSLQTAELQLPRGTHRSDRAGRAARARPRAARRARCSRATSPVRSCRRRRWSAAAGRSPCSAASRAALRRAGRASLSEPGLDACSLAAALTAWTSRPCGRPRKVATEAVWSQAHRTASSAHAHWSPRSRAGTAGAAPGSAPARGGSAGCPPGTPAPAPCTGWCTGACADTSLPQAITLHFHRVVPGLSSHGATGWASHKGQPANKEACTSLPECERASWSWCLDW